MKSLIALYKTYRGGEWFRLSLESVRPHCAGIVVVSSDMPWRGSGSDDAPHLAENCRQPLIEFQESNPDVTILTLRPGQRQNTEEQYQTGLGLIKSLFGTDCGVLLVDTDEVWEDADLLALRQAMNSDRHAHYFRSGIWTYLRSPLYRVAPKEGARVVVGLANPDLPTGRSRLANLHELTTADRLCDVPCTFHHHGYVRADPEEIVSKLANCTSQDVVKTVTNWKQAVWDRLPAGRDIHPQVGFANCWKGVEELHFNSVPRHILESDVFWAGLICHRHHRLRDLFTTDDPAWRVRAEAMPPQHCPRTTVPNNFVVPLSRFGSEALGRPLDFGIWARLVPRFRMSLRELVQLAALATQVPAGGRALEIGSGLGGSMAMMLLAAPKDVTLTAVDPYLPYDEQNVTLDRDVREGSAELFAETTGWVASALGRKRAELLQASSRDAAGRGGLASITDDLDLLLVDGNHSCISCKEDLDLWWPRVKPGGVVLVHDHASRFPGVIQAVKQFEAEQGVRFQLPAFSTLAWLRKV